MMKKVLNKKTAIMDKVSFYKGDKCCNAGAGKDLETLE